MGIVASLKNPLQIGGSLPSMFAGNIGGGDRLKMKARQEVTAVTASQYRGATKK
jgi:hypothetical protein